MFIVSRLPINTETGDRLRVYHFIKKLTERGHKIDILGFKPEKNYTLQTDIESLCRKCIGIEKKDIEFRTPDRFEQLKLFFKSFTRGLPFRVWQWYDEAFIRQAKKMINSDGYDIIHFSEVQSGLVLDALADKKRSSKFVIDLIDSAALSVENSLKKSGILWPFRFIESKRLKKYEQYLVGNTEASILISKRDAEYLKASHAAIIPNGIAATEISGQPRDIDLLFTGNMAAEANIDAACWFAKNVLPELPDVTFYIVGKHPPPAIKKLANEQIVVTGFVEKINEYYQRARLFVCPLRFGAGQKNKVLEAMINKAPVISTPEGNMGINTPADAMVIANNKDEFAEKIVSLLTNEKKRNRLAEKGYMYAETNFSWEKSVHLLEQCYEK